MTLHERGVENRIICIVRKAVKGLLGRTANQGRPSPTQTGQDWFDCLFFISQSPLLAAGSILLRV